MPKSKEPHTVSVLASSLEARGKFREAISKYKIARTRFLKSDGRYRAAIEATYISRCYVKLKEYHSAAKFSSLAADEFKREGYSENAGLHYKQAAELFTQSGDDSEIIINSGSADTVSIVREEISFKVTQEEFSKAENYVKAQECYRKGKMCFGDAGDYYSNRQMHRREFEMICRRKGYELYHLHFPAYWRTLQSSTFSISRLQSSIAMTYHMLRRAWSYSFVWKLLYEQVLGYGESIKKWFLTFIDIILIWTIIYYTFGMLTNGQTLITSFLDCLYFSLVTFTTLGYGDFYPDKFRFLAATEAFLGALMMAWLAILLAGRFSRR